VDDDKGIRHLISTVLIQAGFAATCAGDGQQAWEELLQEHYDLVITDNEMPRLAGIGLIQRMREAGMSVPVIVASGTLPAERVRDDPILRIAAVLPKPFSLQCLLDTVNHTLSTLCEEASPDQHPLQRVGPGAQRARSRNPLNSSSCKRYPTHTNSGFISRCPSDRVAQPHREP